MTSQRETVAVSEALFKQVYDSPRSLPGRHRWLTNSDDVHKIENLLGIPAGSIGAPLWVSGDHKRCLKCKREVNWLDIVSSGLTRKHKKSMIVSVILGEQKYVNTETPDVIADINCFNCGASIPDLRSFKCHNWAYARGSLAKVIKDSRLGGL